MARDLMSQEATWVLLTYCLDRKSKKRKRGMEEGEQIKNMISKQR